jgi:alcohol dehydrogenase
MPVTRELWRIDRAGSLGRLRKGREVLEDPGPGEARVLVKAVGLNFADIFACLGLYSATPRGPFVPGLEFSGIVEALGPHSDRHDNGASRVPIRPGDQVVGLTRFGAYATAVNVDTRLLRPVPAGWTFAEAAAFPVQALTAWYGLVVLGGLGRGQVVLVHSAAGGVGLNALEILRAREARVVGTIGHEAKRAVLVQRTSLRPEQIIVRERRRFGAQLDRALEYLGEDGIDLAFDAIAGPFFRPAYERLRAEGRHVVYGAAAFMPRGTRPNYLRLAAQYVRRPVLDPLRMIAENRSVMAFNLIWLWERAARLAPAFDAVERLVSRPPLVGHRFPFADAPGALRCLQGGRTSGKVVLDT